MLDVRRLTTGAVLLATLGITATPITALSPSHLESIPGQYMAQNLHAHDSQVPNKELSTTSGIEGRSTSIRMPGNIPRNPDGTEPSIKPFVSPAPIPITVLDRAGRKVTRIQPDKEGYFRVTLKPGTYTLASELQKSNFLVIRGDRRQTVTVTKGQFRPVSMQYTVLAP
jgi:hypothetical protein